MDSAAVIKENALRFGFSKCGIIKVDAVKGYKDELDKRVAAFPQSALMYKRFYHYADVRQTFPWALSLVVCVYEHGKFEVPEGLRGRIGRAYLFDGRKDENSEEFRARGELIRYLEGLGMKVGCSDGLGITSLRYAAGKAGLGKVRKNNFFYTENGSWNSIEVFAIDRELELIENDRTKECPEDCSKCMSACPTGSLKGPYSMQPMHCISFITSKSGGLVELAGNPLSERIGRWVYGCDACQTACPFDRRPDGNVKFPGLDAVAENLSLERIIDTDDETYKNKIQPKFWYIAPDMQWMWKVNALNAMKNDYQERYRPYIRKCLDDPNERIRNMAKWICETLNI
jgi:epoxyqueuosine reductase